MSADAFSVLSGSLMVGVCWREEDDRSTQDSQSRVETGWSSVAHGPLRFDRVAGCESGGDGEWCCGEIAGDVRARNEETSERLKALKPSKASGRRIIMLHMQACRKRCLCCLCVSPSSPSAYSPAIIEPGLLEAVEDPSFDLVRLHFLNPLPLAFRFSEELVLQRWMPFEVEAHAPQVALVDPEMSIVERLCRVPVVMEPFLGISARCSPLSRVR